MNLVLIFTSKYFWKEREGERESPDRKERGRSDFADNHKPSSSPTIAPRQSLIAAPNQSLIAEPRRSSIAAPRRSISPPISPSSLPRDLNLTEFDEFFCWVLFLLRMSVELIHYPHVYSWGSVWKIAWLGYVKHFL